VAEEWFAVRCVFRHGSALADEPRLYEERVTLWRAGSAEEAIAAAEEEARSYCDDLDAEYLGLAQSYALSDVPGNGVEVFSLMRKSVLDVQAYLDAFFDTGTESQRHL
jgi:hypothetical protein